MLIVIYNKDYTESWYHESCLLAKQKGDREEIAHLVFSGKADIYETAQHNNEICCEQCGEPLSLYQAELL